MFINAFQGNEQTRRVISCIQQLVPLPQAICYFEE